MPEVDKYNIGPGEQVLIETTDIVIPGQIELMGRSAGEAIDFRAAVDRALPAAQILLQKIQSMMSNVKTIEVEFGLKFSGEVGALIAKTGTEANFKITLSWEPEPKAPTGTPSGGTKP